MVGGHLRAWGPGVNQKITRNHSNVACIAYEIREGLKPITIIRISSLYHSTIRAARNEFIHKMPLSTDTIKAKENAEYRGSIHKKIALQLQLLHVYQFCRMLVSHGSY